jgi:hypothetical protein
MDTGTVPPHWEDLLRHSTKKATVKDFELAHDWMDTTEWMPGQPNVTAGSHITDPFTVVTESSPANATWDATASNGSPQMSLFSLQHQTRLHGLSREETSTPWPCLLCLWVLQSDQFQRDRGLLHQMMQEPIIGVISVQPRTRMLMPGHN